MLWLSSLYWWQVYIYSDYQHSKQLAQQKVADEWDVGRAQMFSVAAARAMVPLSVIAVVAAACAPLLRLLLGAVGDDDSLRHEVLKDTVARLEPGGRANASIHPSIHPS